VLGGLQGAVGGLLVARGLVARPADSHYRRAIHLGLAIVIYAGLLGTALGLLQPRGASALSRRDRGWAHLAYTLIALTILAGALVAGLRAGLIYNSFPLMGEGFVPSDYWLPELGWINAFESRAAVQFHHRVMATVTLLAVAFLWWRVRGASAWLLAAVLLQYGLGIAPRNLVSDALRNPALLPTRRRRAHRSKRCARRRVGRPRCRASHRWRPDSQQS
jgi:cytochrome c oxidase assembly protein subunit 15